MATEKTERKHETFAPGGGDTETGSTKLRQRQKVSGAQLEERFSTWIEARKRRAASNGTPEGTGLRFRRTVAMILGLGLVALAVFTGLSSRVDERASAANDARISALETELAGSRTEASTVTAAAMTDLSVKAAAAANKVNAKQNTFAELYAAMNAEIASGQGNGAPGNGMTAIVEHRRDLAEQWTAASFVVGDRAYDLSSVTDLPGDKIDPRFPWYVRFDGMLASDPKSYGWKVESVMPRLKKPATVGVVWVNRQADGTVLAWSSAVYDGSKGTFSDLEVVVTDAGIQHAQTTGATEFGDKEGTE